MELLKVEGLSKNFGGTQALRRVSFSLQAGEKLAVIGPNGSGKSTLINVLSGLLSPTAGAIYILGQDITTKAMYHRLHLGLSRSFQLNSLFPGLTLHDNVLLAVEGAQNRHYRIFTSDSVMDHLFVEVQQLLEAMGMWGKRHAPINTLSYGEQRQVEILLSLASKSRLLLLDEPTAGLSAAESAILVDLIRNRSSDTAVLFSAHDMDIVFTLADRIMVLNFGEVIAEGRPEEIQANARVREIYLGREEDAQDTGSD